MAKSHDEGARRALRSPQRDDTANRLATLSYGLQDAKDLKTILAMTLIVVTKVKTRETIIAHVEADLENTPQPPTWRAKCWWISCKKNTGYHAKDPTDSNAGGCTREI
jgi:hypothetical protein